MLTATEAGKGAVYLTLFNSFRFNKTTSWFRAEKHICFAHKKRSFTTSTVAALRAVRPEVILPRCPCWNGSGFGGLWRGKPHGILLQKHGCISGLSVIKASPEDDIHGNNCSGRPCTANEAFFLKFDSIKTGFCNTTACEGPCGCGRNFRCYDKCSNDED